MQVAQPFRAPELGIASGYGIRQAWVFPDMPNPGTQHSMARI
jgi:hypothetical protein